MYIVLRDIKHYPFHCISLYLTNNHISKTFYQNCAIANRYYLYCSCLKRLKFDRSETQIDHCINKLCPPLSSRVIVKPLGFIPVMSPTQPAYVTPLYTVCTNKNHCESLIWGTTVGSASLSIIVLSETLCQETGLSQVSSHPIGFSVSLPFFFLRIIQLTVVKCEAPVITISTLYQHHFN